MMIRKNKKTLRFLLLLLGCVFFFTAIGCDEESSGKKLIMVTEATFPPYEYREKGRIVGIDPDIIREISSRNGYELIIVDMNFNSIIAAVQTGKADVAASGITVTEERKRRVNFTTPYISANQVIVVPKKSTVKGRNDCKGHRIGVQHGTTGDQYVTNNIQEPERYENAALLISALITGKLDIAILDNAPAREFVAKNPVLKILDEPLSSEDYAFAISKEQPELLAMFNKTLDEMRRDGTLQKIFSSYRTNDKTPETKTFSNKIIEEVRVNFLDDDRYFYLLNGFLVTLLIAAGAVLLGIILGFTVAIIRTYADQTGKIKILNFFCKAYLTIIRGTPVVVQLLIIYFVIFGSVNIDKVVVAILAFGLNSGAYVAEIIRSGIISIDRGQFEAGRSLGLSYGKTMRLIILPQALKNVLPALGNEFIVLLKETSVSGYIALHDLTKGGDIIRSQTYNAFLPLIAVALIYLAVVMIFTKLLSILEERLKQNE